MPRKAKAPPFEGASTVASILPWWAFLLLAAISFVLFHLLADIRTTAPTTPEVMARTLWVAVGYIGEVFAPLGFLALAGLAGARQVRYGRSGAPRARTPGTEPRPETGDAPAVPDNDLYDVWKDVARTDSRRPYTDTSRWSKDLLTALEWKRFEHVCAGYFETLGFKAKVAREGPDGGIDIQLYAEGSSSPGIVVQCKAWKAFPVGVKQVRELLGVMTATHVSEGVFVTTGGYTAEAKQFAAGNNIQLIDGDDLLKKIAATTSENETALLQLATAGDFTTPTCPSCGLKMVERVAQKSGERFWGCPSFPNCRRTFRITPG